MGWLFLDELSKCGREELQMIPMVRWKCVWGTFLAELL